MKGWIKINSKWHFFISLIKSIIRIISCIGALNYNNWHYIPVGFGMAEILGIAEEILDKR